MNHYQQLDVSETASQEEIKSAFRKKAKELHPDLHSGNKIKEELFKLVTNAYNCLSDPICRQKHDKELSQQRIAERRRVQFEQRQRAQPATAQRTNSSRNSQGKPPQPQRQATRPAPVQATIVTRYTHADQSQSEGLGFWESLLVAGGLLGSGWLLANALSSAGGKWDSTVGRRRGRDGRFRRS